MQTLIQSLKTALIYCRCAVLCFLSKELYTLSSLTSEGDKRKVQIHLNIKATMPECCTFCQKSLTASFKQVGILWCDLRLYLFNYFGCLILHLVTKLVSYNTWKGKNKYGRVPFIYTWTLSQATFNLPKGVLHSYRSVSTLKQVWVLEVCRGH